MSLSVAQLQSVIEEIRALVSASPVRKAYCEDGETFVLELRAVGANHLLLFSLDTPETRSDKMFTECQAVARRSDRLASVRTC